MLPDIARAREFLRILDGRHTFQTFGESKPKRRGLARIIHGTIDEHAKALSTLNAQGAGVFVMVAEGDGRGRKGANVRRIRAVFVDLDGAPLAPVRAGPLTPHCIVQSSSDRYHAYWIVSDCAVADFKAMQGILAARFGGDPSVNDITRVMRLPGFVHQKGDPFQTRILELREAPAYTMEQLRAAFPTPALIAPLKTAAVSRRTVPKIIPDGERNTTLFSLACGLVQKGYALQEVSSRLQRINDERCQPQLCASEVDTIAENAARNGSNGFTIVTHALQDSAEWKVSGRNVHEIVLLALRRFDGSNNGNIALTWNDVRGLEGFRKKEAFYVARARAVTAGFLVMVSEGRHSQAGRKPDLFAIAPRWLSSSARVQKGTMRRGTKRNPYIDKQALFVQSSDSGKAA